MYKDVGWEHELYHLHSHQTHFDFLGTREYFFYFNIQFNALNIEEDKYVIYSSSLMKYVNKVG